MKVKLRELVDKKVKAKLPEYDEKRKIQWDECIALAKTAVRNYKEARIIIAELAIKACNIKQGGRPRHEFYTVKKFAKAIDLPYTTVSNWVTTLLMIKNIEDKDAKQYALDHFYAVNKYIGVADKSKITTEVKAMMKAGPGFYKWWRYLSSIKSIHFNTKHESAMREASHYHLLEILHLSREIAFNIAKFTKDHK